MKATDLLEQQHEEVKAIFKRLEEAEGVAEQKELFEELASNLVAHDAIERQIFYPACEQAMGMTDELGEALVEHGLIEFMLYEADQARGKKDFKFKWTVLREALEHHIEEEEDEFFPKVKKELDAERLEALGTKMEESFEEAREEDFRAPLHKNLKQVLAGALKPSPDRGSSSKGKKKAASRGANHSRAHR
ncbi:MAG TPA: hemerythrin domain-containing protein [Polyangiaceae bacterium]